MRVITLHHNDKLVLYKVVGHELSIRDYQQKNQASHRNHSNWSAFYAQLCPIHAKGTIPYRWDQGYNTANLLCVTVQANNNKVNAGAPSSLSADTTADTLETGSKQTSADTATGYNMANLLCVTAQTNNNKGNAGEPSPAQNKHQLLLLPIMLHHCSCCSLLTIPRARCVMVPSPKKKKQS
jgi:hypothetical protein